MTLIRSDVLRKDLQHVDPANPQIPNGRLNVGGRNTCGRKTCEFQTPLKVKVEAFHRCDVAPLTLGCHDAIDYERATLDRLPERRECLI